MPINISGSNHELSADYWNSTITLLDEISLKSLSMQNKIKNFELLIAIHPKTKSDYQKSIISICEKYSIKVHILHSNSHLKLKNKVSLFLKKYKSHITHKISKETSLLFNYLNAINKKAATHTRGNACISFQKTYYKKNNIFFLANFIGMSPNFSVLSKQRNIHCLSFPYESASLKMQALKVYGYGSVIYINKHSKYKIKGVRSPAPHPGYAICKDINLNKDNFNKCKIYIDRSNDSHDTKDSLSFYCSKLDNPKMLVVIHAHYKDVLLKILKSLKNATINFDILITPSCKLRSELTNLDLFKYAKKILSNMCSLYIPNISLAGDMGVDIAYFYESFNFINLSKNYKYFMKLHTKKGNKKRHFGKTNDQFLSEILSSFLGSESLFDKNIEKINERFVICNSTLLHNYPYRGEHNASLPVRMTDSNVHFFNHILNKYCLTDINNIKYKFFAGSFIFSDFDYFKLLYKYKSIYNFPSKKSFKIKKRDDGNLEHAFERFLVFVLLYNNYEFWCSKTNKNINLNLKYNKSYNK